MVQVASGYRVVLAELQEVVPRASGPLATQIRAEVSRPSFEWVSPHVSLILITIHSNSNNTNDSSPVY